MDYTSQNFLFKLKKAWRYVRLYGPRRTLIKVQGQYHMKRSYKILPQLPDQSESGAHVGLIGCGNFAFSNIAYYVRKNFGQVIRAAMDININRAVSLSRKYGLRYYTDKAERVLQDPEIDLVYVASNHASHAEYAIQAIESGKSVHIEKPHVVTEDQLERLCNAMESSKGRVFLGFNRPNSIFGQKIKQALDAEEGPAMLNWFVAGHEISPDHWYFKNEEGGRVLGNLCHWTDFVYNMIPEEKRYPITVTPTRATKSDCDIAVTYVFGDGSIAAITFSAKGHTFEGVREKFAAHRGNVLISMDDFKTLTIENMDKKTIFSPKYRDHGHEENICKSYEMRKSDLPGNDPCSIKYVWETADLFLKTRHALETQEKLILHSYEDSCLPGLQAL